MPSAPLASPTPNPMPQQGEMFAKDGKLNEVGWFFLNSLRNGAITALNGTTIASVDLFPVGGVVIPDLKQSGYFGSFVVQLGPTLITVDIPIFTGGSVPAGAEITIFADQDATGGDVPLAFETGIGGFPAFVNSLVIVGEPLTRTTYGFKFDGVTWNLKSFMTGESI